MAYYTYKEAKIHYQVKGKGRAVVLLHGFLCSMQIWSHLVPELSKKYKVIVIDLPGHGQSECIGYIHKMEMVADTVKAVLNHLQLRKYVLIGHSMGGYISLAFAEKYMENLRGLVLFHSTALADNEERKAGRDKAIRVVKKNRAKYLHESLKKWFYPVNIKKNPAMFKQAEDIAGQASTQGIIAALEGMKQRKNTEVVLKFSKVPVMFIVGLYDLLIPLETNRHIYSLPEKGRVLLLEHSAHMGFFEEPDSVVKGLFPYLRECFGPIDRNE